MTTRDLSPLGWCRLGPLSELPTGGLTVDVDGDELALFRTSADELFLVQGACPHLGGPLGDGSLDGTTVVCPWHRWSYDVRTGERTDRVGSRLRRYAVRIVDGWVEACLPGRPPVGASS